MIEHVNIFLKLQKEIKKIQIDYAHVNNLKNVIKKSNNQKLKPY